MREEEVDAVWWRWVVVDVVGVDVGEIEVVDEEVMEDFLPPADLQVVVVVFGLSYKWH